MIKRPLTQPKQTRNIFVPFQNERDQLGRIIKPRTLQKSEFNVFQLFQNLKKSTKEYFFDKQFQKMSKKFEQVKKSLESKDHDYDKEVDCCLKLADKITAVGQKKDKQNQALYISLREQIDEKINGVRHGLKRYKFSNQKLKKKLEPEFILKDLNRENSPPKSINTELFKNISKRSELMATFCEFGLRHAGVVERKKFHPWKKWYKEQEFEIFPGKIVRAKCLEKSLF